MNVLCACEESQAVVKEFRKLGQNAFSCDIQKCSGGFPEWHINDDVLSVLNGCCDFFTENGEKHSIFNCWDMIIAFPPCTYLSNAGNRHLLKPGRLEKREEAAQFFMKIVNADCLHIAVENPVGYMNTYYRKPSQIIEPYMFGDFYRKRTCLWLKGLPLLEPDYLVPAPAPIYIQSNGKKRNWVDTRSGSERQKIRSKTFPGIAAAMAWQWSINPFIL